MTYTSYGGGGRMDPALFAVIGTVFGGVGLKIVEHLLGKSREKTDLASELRDELREDMKALREELKEEREKNEVLEEKYWALKTGNQLTNYKVDSLIEASAKVHPDLKLPESLKDIPK